MKKKKQLKIKTKITHKNQIDHSRHELNVT